MTDAVKICALEDIVPETGVCALLNDKQIAIFRTKDDQVFAIDNYDPFSQANVLSRGLIGATKVDGEEVLYVASPIYKQRFSFLDGKCLDDDSQSIGVHTVRIEDGGVYL